MREPIGTIVMGRHLLETAAVDKAQELAGGEPLR
jgi:hypothetical protein